jgi:hypothetical protein
LSQPRDRSEYQRAYYEANKERKKAIRKAQPRTEGAKAAEARYRERQRIRREIEAIQLGGDPWTRLESEGDYSEVAP